MGNGHEGHSSGVSVLHVDQGAPGTRDEEGTCPLHECGGEGYLGLASNQITSHFEKEDWRGGGKRGPQLLPSFFSL